MEITLGRPDVGELDGVVEALREWQDDGAATQLHPGDVGWFWRFGAEATAAAVRTWSRDGRLLAAGLLDGPAVLRLTTAPDVRRDPALAQQLASDLTRPDRDVLPEGAVNAEVPHDALLRDLLEEEGWVLDEPWTPLRRDLSEPVEDPGVRVETTEADGAHRRTAVHRASFERSTFTDERWRAMADGPVYAGARCLVAHDEWEAAVAAVTVWSAGPGRPGLIEPLGVHRDHRGRGHGRAVTLAAAAALRELGCSSAVVVTPSANVGAVATYASAGFEPLAEIHDRRREA